VGFFRTAARCRHHAPYGTVGFATRFHSTVITEVGVNVALRAALVAVAVSIAPVAAHAVWYAQGDPDGGVAQCVEAEDSIDDAWAHVNEGWARASGGRAPKCTLNREGGRGLIGFLIDCGQGGEHFYFRTREHCETFKRTVNARGALNVEEFAAEGTANPREWISALGACLDRMATPETIQQAGLHAISTVCECLASKLGAQNSTATVETASLAWIACLRVTPPATRAKLIMDFKPDRKAATEPASDAPAKK
jgi:hypothetical protein